MGQSTWYERYKQQQLTPTPNAPPTSPTAPPSSGSRWYDQYRQQQQPVAPVPSTTQKVIAGGLRTVPAVAGSLLGGTAAGIPTLGLGSFGGGIAGGAAGSALGESLAEWYEKSQGIRKEFNPYQVATQTALGAVPFFGKAPGFGAGARAIGKYALSGAGQGALLGGASAVGTGLAETGNLPTLGEVGQGAAFGGLFGGATAAGLGKYASVNKKNIDPALLPQKPAVKVVPPVKQLTEVAGQPPGVKRPGRVFIVTPGGKIASSLDPNINERLATLENKPPGSTATDYDKRHGEYYNIGGKELPPVDLSVLGERKGPDVYPARTADYNPGHPEGKFEGPFALSAEERALQAERGGRRNQGIGVRQPETNTVFVTIEDKGNKTVHTVSIRPDENPAEAVRKYMASRKITGNVTHAEVVKGPAPKPNAERAIRGKVISGEETPADWLSDDPLYSHVPDRLRPEPPNVGRLRTLSEGAEKQGATGPVPNVEPISGPRNWDKEATTVTLTDDLPPVTPINPPLNPLPTPPAPASAPPRESLVAQRKRERIASGRVATPQNIAKARSIIQKAEGNINVTRKMTDNQIIDYAAKLEPDAFKPLPKVTKPTGGPPLANSLPAVEMPSSMASNVTEGGAPNLHLPSPDVEITDPKTHLASYTDDDGYTVSVHSGSDDSPFDRRGYTIIKSPDGKTVLSGYWMDTPEESWGISERDYHNLADKRRASLEALQQATAYKSLKEQFEAATKLGNRNISPEGKIMPKGNATDNLEIETDEIDLASSITGRGRRRKAIAGTAAIPIEGKAGEGLRGLINYKGFMNKNPVFKAIMDKFIKHRSLDRLISAKVREDFKDIAGIPKEKIVEFQKDLNEGRYTEVRKFFDDMHAKLTKEGIEVDFKKDYLPQMWDNSAEEIAKVYGDKELNAKASFQFESIFKDYQAGIDAKLTPKLSPIELIDYYAKRANKLSADTEAIKYLKAFGYITDNYKPGMEALDSNIVTFGKYYADPSVRKVLEGFLKSKETQSPIGSHLSKSVGKWSNALLSAGVVPKRPILTAHGLNIANPIGGRAMQEGGWKRVKQSLEYGFNPKKAVERLKNANEKMQWATKEHGYSAGIGDASALGPKLFEMEGKNAAAKLGIKSANKITELQHKYFEKPLLEEMLPAIKWEAWESHYNRLMKAGHSDSEAGRLATEITDNFYGGANLDLLYNNKAFNNFARTALLAPDWFRTTFRLGGKMAKSAQFRTMPPAERIAYLGGVFKIMATYAAANLAHKAINGTFMVENKNPFDFEMGKDSSGKKRVYNLFGGAADSYKLIVDRMQTDDKAAEFEEQADYLKNRASPAVRALDLAWQGRDYRGRPNLRESTDQFGNEVPLKDRLKNTAIQAANLAPPYISQPFNYLSGEQGLEEALMRMTELPINYKHQKNKNRGGSFSPFKPGKPSPFTP